MSKYIPQINVDIIIHQRHLFNVEIAHFISQRSKPTLYKKGQMNSNIAEIAHRGHRDYNFIQIRQAYLISAFSVFHYSDVIMSAIASQITRLTIVCSTVYSDADQRKHRSSASMAFVRPVNSPHKGSVTRKMFPFDDVIMFIWLERKRIASMGNGSTKYLHLGDFVKLLDTFSIHCDLNKMVHIFQDGIFSRQWLHFGSNFTDTCSRQSN